MSGSNLTKVLLRYLASAAIGAVATVAADHFVVDFLGRPDIAGFKVVATGTTREGFAVQSDWLPQFRAQPIWDEAITSVTTFECDRQIAAGILRRECLKQLNAGLRAAGDILTFRERCTRSDLKNVKGQGGNRQPVFLSGLCQDRSALSSIPKQEAIRRLEGELQGLTKSIKAQKGLHLDIQGQMGATKNDWFFVDVGMLNSGDTDAVVFQNATIGLGDQEIPLLMMDAQTLDRRKRPPFQILKAHSAVSLTYEPDWNSLGDNQKKAVEGVVADTGVNGFVMQLETNVEANNGEITLDGEFSHNDDSQ